MINQKIDKTDKHKHGLITFYEKEFDHLKEKPIVFFELGIFKGDSLLYWNEYFKNAKKIKGL